MATFTNDSKTSSATFSTQAKSTGMGGTSGTPIGLLLALTYASSQPIPWSNQSKNSAIFTNEAKN